MISAPLSLSRSMPESRFIYYCGGHIFSGYLWFICRSGEDIRLEVLQEKKLKGVETLTGGQPQWNGNNWSFINMLTLWKPLLGPLSRFSAPRLLAAVVAINVSNEVTQVVMKTRMLSHTSQGHRGANNSDFLSEYIIKTTVYAYKNNTSHNWDLVLMYRTRKYLCLRAFKHFRRTEVCVVIGQRTCKSSPLCNTIAEKKTAYSIIQVYCVYCTCSQHWGSSSASTRVGPTCLANATHPVKIICL